MTTRAALLAAALVLCGSARAEIAPAAPVAYDAKTAPLDDLCKEMLTGNGYELRDDGTVWDKIGEAPVSQSDMPYLLSRLASAKRLRALLELNNIITRYDAERKLTPEDKEAVRALVRQNWVVFGNVPRNDFRSYFSVEELESLDKIAPRFEAMSAMTMTDPSTESVTAAAPSAGAPAPAKAAAAAPSVTALPPAPAVAAPSITALPPAPAAAPAAPSVTALPPPVLPAAVAPAAPAVAAVPPAAAPTVAPVSIPPASAVVAAPPVAPPPPAAAPAVVADVPAVPAPAVVPISVPPAPAVVAAPPVAPAPAAPAVVADVPVVPAPAVVPVSVPPAPAVVPVPAAPPPAAPQALAAAAPAAVAVAAIPARIIPTLTPMMDMPSLKRGSPFAPAAPAEAPAAVPAPAPAAPPSVPIAPPPAPAAPAAVPPVAVAAAPAAPVTYKIEPAAPPKLPEIVAAPAAPSTAAVVASDLGTLKPWTPPPSLTPAVAVAPKPAAVAISTPAAPAAPPAPEPPKAAVIGETEYAKFVADGPYNAGGKAVLELIGKRAPDYCLPLLRRTVVGAVPQIVSDGARTGAELRAGYARDAANPLAPPVVALSPGPVFVEVKKSVFGGRDDVLLPESPQAWTDLGVARPALDALRENAASVSTENGDWGAVRVYADGSRRGSYSTIEMGGELLEQLLLLGLSREGLDASTYAARSWARTARLMFYARLKDETQQDNFLDPDRRAELRGWLDHPDEIDDLTAAAWGGSRRQLLDPRRGPPASALQFETRARASCVRSALEDALSENARRRAARVGELETLLDAGVVDSSAAKSAAQAATDAEAAERRRLVAAPPACPAPDAAREEGLRKAALLLAESARAERLMREHKAGIEGHAL